MSRCQMVAVEDLGRMCAVHGYYAPCPANGKPALPYPIHVYSEPDQVAAIDKARETTAGSRPIVVHHGHESDAGHLVQLGETQCWCDYVTIPSG